MRIAYYPAGTREFASSRLRVWKIVDALTALGHEVSVNGDPFKADTIVVQKRTDLYGIMQQARQKGIRVVYDIDDYIPNMAVEFADVTTVDTAAKLELYPNAVIIPDALDVEIDSPQKTEHKETLESVVWTGNTDNMYHVLYAARACYNLGINLTLITQLNHPRWTQSFEKFHGLNNISLIDWDLETVDQIMVQHDLAIFPFTFDDGGWSKEWVSSKSANRLLKAWALGLPAAGTPIPSYVGAGLLNCAQTVTEWVAVLARLKDCDERMVDIGMNYQYAQDFRAEKVVDQWLIVFQA